jgi:thioredoxin-related protein
MFTTSICDYCAIFDEEIGQPYAQNDLSKKAPLIRINLDEYGTGPYHLKKPLMVAPTFVIMKGDDEIARMRGHMDRFSFLAFVRDAVYPYNKLAFFRRDP